MIDKDKLMELVSNIAHSNSERSFLYGIVGEMDMQAQRIEKLEKQVQAMSKQTVGTGPATVTKKKTTKKAPNTGDKQ